MNTSLSSVSDGSGMSDRELAYGKVTTREPPCRLADSTTGVSFIHLMRALVSGCVTLPSPPTETYK